MASKAPRRPARTETSAPAECPNCGKALPSDQTEISCRSCGYEFGERVRLDAAAHEVPVVEPAE